MPCRDGVTRQDGSVQHFGVQDTPGIGTGLSAAKCAFDLLTCRWPATVPHDELQARLARALAAGGTLLSDAAAPSFWVLADAEGNEACVCTWADPS